jgi:uncharacterized protein (TIGR00369 family)
MYAKEFIMTDFSARPIAASATAVSQVLRAEQSNVFATIHGGELIKLMDNAGGICALRHANAPVATKAIAQATFHQPAYAGELAVCRSRLVFVKHKVMEIQVELSAQGQNDAGADKENSRLCVSGFFYYVALDITTRKTLPVPPLELQNPAEIQAAEAGARRLELFLELVKPPSSV